MDILYWASLVFGGITVLASIFGAGDVEADADVDLDAEVDADGPDAGGGWVDLFSLRTVLLFAAFFGLCGVLLPLAEVGELTRALVSLATGLVIGVVGNLAIKRVGYEHVSSTITADDLHGRTGKVLIPFGQADKGKILLIGKGQRIQLVARSYEGAPETFSAGDEVVVIRINGAIAEVVKPS